MWRVLLPLLIGWVVMHVPLLDLACKAASTVTTKVRMIVLGCVSASRSYSFV